MRGRVGGEGKVAKHPEHRHSHHWIQEEAFDHPEEGGEAAAFHIFPSPFIQLEEDEADGVEDDEGDGSDKVEQADKFVTVPKDGLENWQTNPKVICLGRVDCKDGGPGPGPIKDKIGDEDKGKDDGLGDEDGEQEGPLDVGEVEGGEAGEDESRQGELSWRHWQWQ